MIDIQANNHMQQLALDAIELFALPPMHEGTGTALEAAQTLDIVHGAKGK